MCIRDSTGTVIIGIQLKDHDDLIQLKQRVNHFDPSNIYICLLYTSPSPRDMRRSRMPSSA
ncbi:hypothetical protein JMUB7528_28590 [Staphylococcus aureus]